MRLPAVLVLLQGLCALAAPQGSPAGEPLSETAALAEPLLTVVEHHAPPQQPLPDTSAITGELTEKLGVSKFFALWLVFNDPTEIDLQTGTEFTILAPRGAAPLAEDAAPSLVRRMLLDHVVLGQRLRLAERLDLQPFTALALGGRTINFTHHDGSWFASGSRVLEPETVVPPSGEVVVLDSFLFSDYALQPEEIVTAPPPDPAPAVEAMPETEAPSVSVDDPVRPLEALQEEKHVDEPLPATSEAPDATTTVTTEESAETGGNLAEELEKLPAVFNLTRVPVFNKFLKDANVSQMLQPGEQYTVLFPMDRAFQRWHPIDWGFYPFSVPEFTADVVRSHFVRGVLRYDSIADNQTVTTITNRTITFRRTAAGELTANGVTVMRRDVTLRGGMVLVVPEVLFVTHQIVQELRSHNRDKETPPLLAFPWWNAQFLSHAYLAIEKDANFTSMERLLNVAANLHLKVPGKNYSFVVPTDAAFTRAELEVPDWWSERSASELLPSSAVMAVERLLLRHLVPGRIYKRELVSGMTLHALDNSTHTLSQKEDGEFVIDGMSRVVEGDVFVYNLGTMFYVDGVLGSEAELAEVRTALATPLPTSPLSEPAGDVLPALPPLGESELDEEGGNGSDVLLEEGTTTVAASTATTAAPEAVTTESATTMTGESATVTTAPQTEAPEAPPAESNDIPAVVAPAEP